MRPPGKENAAAGTAASAEKRQQLRNGDGSTRPRKSGRTRFLRWFPERLEFLLAHLDAADLAAYLRITVAYVVRGADLPGDDRKLARIARLKPAAWAGLRDQLQDLGIAQVIDGRWRDADQDRNIELQEAFSESQRKRANGRWHPRVVK
jgi:hypothetical protein